MSGANTTMFGGEVVPAADEKVFGKIGAVLLVGLSWN